MNKYCFLNGGFSLDDSLSLIQNLFIHGFSTRPILGFPQKRVLECEKIYFVDGGIKFASCFEKLVAKKIYWIGDKDSAKQIDSKKLLQENAISEISYSSKKNHSDSALAFQKIQSELDTNVDVLQVFGALGERKDHELINLLELSQFVQNANSPLLVFVAPNIFIFNSKLEITFHQPVIFSLISFQQSLSCSIENALYSGKIHLTHPSFGLSNEVEKNVEIKIDIDEPQNNRALFLIFQAKVEK